MCKNHDQLHYHPTLREVAYIMSCQDADVRDAILRAATHTGLHALLDLLSLAGLGEAERVRCLSRLEAVAIGSGPEKALLDAHLARLRAEPPPPDEVPF